QDIRRQPGPIGELALTVLAEIDACQDAYGNGDHRGHKDNDDATYQRIGNAAARLAHRLRDVNEKMPVDLGDTGLDDKKEDGQERNHTGKSQDIDKYLKAPVLAKPEFYTIDIHTLVVGEAIDDLLADHVDHNGDEEENQAQLDERGKIHRLIGFGEFVGDDAGHGVARGKDIFRDQAGIPDDHRNGHGLAQRAAQRKQDAGKKSRLGIGQYDAADHLPASRTQAIGRLFKM